MLPYDTAASGIAARGDSVFTSGLQTGIVYSNTIYTNRTDTLLSGSMACANFMTIDVNNEMLFWTTARSKTSKGCNSTAFGIMSCQISNCVHTVSMVMNSTMELGPIYYDELHAQVNYRSGECVPFVACFASFNNVEEEWYFHGLQHV